MGTAIFGVVAFASFIFAQTSGGGGGDDVSLSWATLLFGYGPLGIFAIMVGIDKVGNNSERNRLRASVEAKDKEIAALHQKMEDTVLPQLHQTAAISGEAAKATAAAVEVLRDYDGPRSSSTRSRRSD